MIVRRVGLLLPAFLALALPETAGAEDIQLATPRTLPLGPELTSGRVEHHAVTLYGIPVRGAYRTVSVDSEGKSRVVASRQPTENAQLRPDQARVQRADLPARLRVELGLEDEPEVESEQLVYYMVLGRPVLAWEAQLPLRFDPDPTAKTLWLGASSGVLLDERETVLASRAEVFAENPAITPFPTTVDLTQIAVEEGGLPLDGPRLRAFNCTLTEPLDPEDIVEWREEDECYAVQRTLSDHNGDYFVPMPDVKIIAQNLDADDLYAELSMYYHAEKFLDVMAENGIDEFQCEVATLVANFRFFREHSESAPELPYAPLNNAYYTNRCEFETGPTMLFGQGSAVDFAWDGDVVYHELGHGMVQMLTPEGLSTRRLRVDGSLVDASAMNEAMADYFSVMVTDDPDLADYVGRYWPSATKAYIRTAENQKECPRDTIGQSHNDGEPLMAALWATRKRVGPVLDKAVITTLTRISPDAALEDFAGLVLDVAKELRQAGELTDFDLDVLFRSLDSRGLLDCPRVISDPVAVVAERNMHLRRNTSGAEPFYPGPMQISHVIPEGSDNLTVLFRLSGEEIDEPGAVKALLKRGGGPIAFSYDLVAIDQGDPSAEADVDELTIVSGDWDMELDVTFLAERDREVIVRGLLPGETVTIMLVNTTEKDITASKVRIISAPAGDVDQGSSADGGGTDGDDPRSAGGSDSAHGAGSSCACRGSSSASPLMLLVFLALATRRRRCEG